MNTFIYKYEKITNTMSHKRVSPNGHATRFSALSAVVG